MKTLLRDYLEADVAVEKVCEDCGNKEGMTGADGTPVKVERYQGQQLCTDCIEALAYVLQGI